MTSPASRPGTDDAQSSGDGRPEAPGTLAAEVFGSELAVAVRYAELLAGDGVAHGHIGPREIPRLWSRHLLNCAVVTDLLPQGAEVVDVGSGAGLPGLAMAIRRPDLQVSLVEPMQRRIDFLQRCADDLQLGSRVTLVRGRADDPEVVVALAPARWVTARAVAPLDRLVRWCLPLVSRDGTLLAVKGRGAQDEVARHAVALRRGGVEVRTIAELPVGDDVTRVVVATRTAVGATGRSNRRGGR